LKRLLLVLTFLAASSYALTPNESSTPQAEVNKAQRPDSPEDMEKLLAETAETYREAKSFRIEREMVNTPDLT
jgi:hypothetical protein